MSRKREAVMIGIGILAGLALSGPAAAAADYLQAIPSRQTFYVNGQKVEFEAYSIHGNNFVIHRKTPFLMAGFPLKRRRRLANQV